MKDSGRDEVMDEWMDGWRESEGEGEGRERDERVMNRYLKVISVHSVSHALIQTDRLIQTNRPLQTYTD